MSVKPSESPLTADRGEAEKKARPPHGADDGKTGGHTQGKAGQQGKAAAVRSPGEHTAGINAQSGQESGSETERDAPGISTDKWADDTK